MKKRLLLFLILICPIFVAYSQSTIFNNPENRGHWGIRIGGDLALPGAMRYENVGINLFNVGGGVNIGFHYSAPVAANFYIEPGIITYTNIISIKKMWLPGGVNRDFIMRGGIRIPLMAGYHFDFSKKVSFHIFTGPEFELGIIGEEYQEKGWYERWERENIYGNEDAGFKRVDFSWIIGGAITVRNLYFGLSGGIGMLNILKDKPFIVNDPTVTFHENRVTFTFGVHY